MFAQEPWTYKPWEIGRLTDWQIVNLYAKPAAERSEAMRKDMPGGGGSSSPSPRPSRNEIPHEPGTEAHRNMIVAGMMAGPFAYSRAKAEAAYDKQLADYKASQGK